MTLCTSHHHELSELARDIECGLTQRALPSHIRAKVEEILQGPICKGFLAIDDLLKADDHGDLLATKIAAGKLCSVWNDSPRELARDLRKQVNGVRV